MASDFSQVIEDVRRAATAKGRAGIGAFVVEGRRLLERAIRSGWAPRHLLVGASVCEEQPQVESLLRQITALGSACHFVPDAQLLALSEGRRSGLLTALFPIPSGLSLSELLVSRPAPAIFLAIVDVEEPGNVGALIRTALASDSAGVICVGSSDPFHPKAVRTSLGSLFKLPMTRLSSSEGLLSSLRERQIHTLATVARDGASIDRAAWPVGSVAIFVGNEGRGLSDGLRSAADGRVSIDLSTAADSYCVNAAAAVCLYEVQRRLRFRP